MINVFMSSIQQHEGHIVARTDIIKSFNTFKWLSDSA